MEKWLKLKIFYTLYLFDTAEDHKNLHYPAVISLLPLSFDLLNLVQISFFLSSKIEGKKSYTKTISIH